MFAFPPRLHQVNERMLPVAAHAYRTAGELAEIVDREQPDVVMLFSGYLFVVNKLLTQEAVAGYWPIGAAAGSALSPATLRWG